MIEWAYEVEKLSFYFRILLERTHRTSLHDEHSLYFWIKLNFFRLFTVWGAPFFMTIPLHSREFDFTSAFQSISYRIYNLTSAANRTWSITFKRILFIVLDTSHRKIMGQHWSHRLNENIVLWILLRGDK